MGSVPSYNAIALRASHVWILTQGPFLNLHPPHFTSFMSDLSVTIKAKMTKENHYKKRERKKAVSGGLPTRPSTFTDCMQKVCTVVFKICEDELIIIFDKVFLVFNIMSHFWQKVLSKLFRNSQAKLNIYIYSYLSSYLNICMK